MKYSEFKDLVIDIREVDDMLANLSVEGELFGYNSEDIFSVAFDPVRRYVRRNYRWLMSEYEEFNWHCLNVGTKIPGIEYRLHTLMVESYRRYHAIGSVLVDGTPALCFIRSGCEGSDYISTYVLDIVAANTYTKLVVGVGLVGLGYWGATVAQLPPVLSSDLLERDGYHQIELATTDTTLSGYVWQPSDKLFGVVGVLDDDGDWVPLRQGLSYEDIKDIVIGTTNRLDLVPGLALWYLIGGDLYGVTDRQFLVGVESNHIACITHAYVPPPTELKLEQVYVGEMDTYTQVAGPHQHHVCSVLVRGTPAFYFTYVWDSNDMASRLDIYILNEAACNDFLQVVIRLLLQDIKVAPYEEVEHWGCIHYVGAGDKVEGLTVSAGTRIQYGNGASSL